MTTEIEKHYYQTGELYYEIPYENGERHGIQKGYYKTGEVNYIWYYLYGNEVTEEEYRKHQLTEQLAGI